MEPAAATIQMGTSLRDALSSMLVVDYANVCVVDRNSRVRGLVNIDLIQQTVAEGEAAAADEEEG